MKRYRTLLITLLLLMLAAPLLPVRADTQGPNLPGLAGGDNTVGTVIWVNNNNIEADDGVDAICQLQGSDTGIYIKPTVFGFSIPAGATINGITVTVKRFQDTTSGTGDVQDNSVRIVQAGTIAGDEKAQVATDWATSYEIATYGGGADLWGLTWTVAQINSSNTGVAISCHEVIGAARTAHIDVVKMTVTFTPAAAGKKRIIIMSQTGTAGVLVPALTP